jgi:hypothetical protein
MGDGFFLSACVDGELKLMDKNQSVRECSQFPDNGQESVRVSSVPKLDR